MAGSTRREAKYCELICGLLAREQHVQLAGPIAGAPGVKPIAILASLMPSSRSSQSPPTPLIDASYEAVRFDKDWVITLRRAFSRAVKAMVCVPTRRHRQLEAFNQTRREE
jgi:hypothetical protein